LKKQPEKRKTITELLEHSFLNESIIWVFSFREETRFNIYFFHVSIKSIIQINEFINLKLRTNQVWIKISIKFCHTFPIRHIQ
jgi:hypothetical protein